VKANKGAIRQMGRGVAGGERGGSNKGVGACFAEVEVDTWTGNWRFVRATYVHDTGLVINPLVAEADMVGSLVESTQVATDAIPWIANFQARGTIAWVILSYRCRRSWTSPADAVYIDSLEPRWFYGIKSFSETSIGPCRAQSRTPSITRVASGCGSIRYQREKIMAGLNAKRGPP